MVVIRVPPSRGSSRCVLTYLHRWDRLHYGNSDPYDAASHHTRFSPLAHIRNARTPTLILHGEQDWDVPHGITESAHRLDLLTRLRDWFVEHLAG